MTQHSAFSKNNSGEDFKIVHLAFELSIGHVKLVHHVDRKGLIRSVAAKRDAAAIQS